MHSKCDNIMMQMIMMQMMLSKNSLIHYQNNLEKSMVGSEFIFYSVQLMYYKCHKVNFRRGG